ncbi:hypothetical protein GCM10023311_16260 [Flaviramulus aquimarinus]|uniref:WG containing repeat-containing protein n=1 Tax=Flaviramulus aquimarinus TaxID=1170456 RepID=A0ABP9F200_9FLAO
MKFKIAITFILLFSINLFAQEVTLESEKMTTEQKRVQKIEEEIRKLEDDYAKSKAQHEKNTKGLFPNSFSLNADKNVLAQKKKENEAVLYSMQESGLKEKAKQIDILSNSIGHKFSYRSALQGRINKLNENIKNINNRLSGLQKKEGEENTDKIKYNIEVSKLDDEISNLDALLAKSKVEKTKKTKSLDDFLNESGRTSSTKKSSSNNLDDLLAGSSQNKKATSSNLDDLLSSKSKSKSNEKDLDALLGSVEDDIDFKIDYNNGLTGVINSRGKVLIPYRNWSILEYKMGYAKVRKKIETKSCYETCTAYKEGFVDKKGDFIDGYEIDFSYDSYKSNGPLRLIAIKGHDPNKESYLQYLNRKERDERDSKRRKAREKREKEIERKKCKIEINNWKNSIKSRYR